MNILVTGSRPPALSSESDATPSIDMEQAALDGGDVVIWHEHSGMVFVGRGRVYATERDALKNLKGRAKRQSPPTSRDHSSEFREDAVSICRWFYSQPTRDRPTHTEQFEDILTEVRLVLEKDMDDTPKPQRVVRLRRILTAALADDFWSRQIISLGGIRKKGKNGRMKWKNAEAGLQDTVASGVYESGDTSWKKRYGS